MFGSTIFQSARPVRGATVGGVIFGPMIEFQSARPVRGATFFSAQWTTCCKISIRAPRAGRDSKNAQIVLHFFNNSQPKIEIQRPAQAGRAI